MLVGQFLPRIKKDEINFTETKEMEAKCFEALRHERNSSQLRLIRNSFWHKKKLKGGERSVDTVSKIKQHEIKNAKLSPIHVWRSSCN